MSTSILNLGIFGFAQPDVPVDPPKEKEDTRAETSPVKELSVPRLLIVDDDESFTKIVAKVAQSKNIPVTICNSVKEVSKLSKWEYDVAVVDYDLGDITGVQLTDFFERIFHDIPVILVSQYRQVDTKRWPTSIKHFVHKSAGPFGIISAAFEAHQMATLSKE